MAQTKTGGSSTDKAAAAGSDAKPQRKRITRRKAVEEKVRAYYEAMDNRDVDAMVALWADDGVEDVVPIGVIRGREELRAFLSGLFAAMPDARVFVYTVSLTGTTGERDEISPDLAAAVERVRESTDVPVAVGFGISTGEQARTVAEIADGVIVGSRVVRAAGEGGAEAVGEQVRALAQALE